MITNSQDREYAQAEQTASRAPTEIAHPASLSFLPSDANEVRLPHIYHTRRTMTLARGETAFYSLETESFPNVKQTKEALSRHAEVRSEVVRRYSPRTPVGNASSMRRKASSLTSAMAQPPWKRLRAPPPCRRRRCTACFPDKRALFTALTNVIDIYPVRGAGPGPRQQPQRAAGALLTLAEVALSKRQSK